MSHFKVHKLDSDDVTDNLKCIVRTPLNHSAITGRNFKCKHWVVSTKKFKRVT